MIDLKKHIVSAVCAVSMVLSAVVNPFSSVSPAVGSTESTGCEAAVNDGELIQQSFELYPNEEDQERTITLAGEMPEGAVPEAVNVSEEHEGIVAYDISISDGDSEYQPDEEHPVYVEINDPAISQESGIELWHISDDGERERITDITVDDGKISFYAVGFSVYEIVGSEHQENVPLESVKSIDELTGDRAEKGFYWFYSSDIFVTSELNSDGCLKESSKKADAAIWYFEADNGNYRIYTRVDGKKKYICTDSGNKIKLSDNYDLFEISETQGNSFYFKNKDYDKWLQHSNGGGGIRYYTANSNAVNSCMKLYFNNTVTSDDPCGLDGKSYVGRGFTFAGKAGTQSRRKQQGPLRRSGQRDRQVVL